MSLVLQGIRPDESLDSFCSRNIILHNLNPTSFFKSIGYETTVRRWSHNKIDRLSTALGLSGVHGINYLLHHHTNYFRCRFVCDQTHCYLPGSSLAGMRAIREVAGPKVAKLCPKCAQDDYINLGFVYLRRSQQAYDITVCAEHNVQLVQACGGCSKPFNSNNHFIEFPWLGCECGFGILDLHSVKNVDGSALWLAKFIKGLFQYQYFLCPEDMNKLILDRLEGLGLLTKYNIRKKFSSALSELHYDVVYWNLMRAKAGHKLSSWGASYILSLLHADFNEFALDVLGKNVRRTSVLESWNYCGIQSLYINIDSAPFCASH